MMSSNGNIFRVTGHLCGAFTGNRWIPLTKASDAELWCFLWWINGWVNNREAGDLRRHRAHYDVAVMLISSLHMYEWSFSLWWRHMSVKAPHLTGISTVCSTVNPDERQRKYQRSATTIVSSWITELDIFCASLKGMYRHNIEYDDENKHVYYSLFQMEVDTPNLPYCQTYRFEGKHLSFNQFSLSFVIHV